MTLLFIEKNDTVEVLVVVGDVDVEENDRLNARLIVLFILLLLHGNSWLIGLRGRDAVHEA
jgi:hypothetical protein